VLEWARIQGKERRITRRLQQMPDIKLKGTYSRTLTQNTHTD
jgi:hypothetical protein